MHKYEVMKKCLRPLIKSISLYKLNRLNGLMNELMDEKVPYRSRFKESLDLEKSFLDRMVPIDNTSTHGIKVRINYPGHYSWNCIKSVCLAFEEDERFDVRVIIPQDILYAREVMQRENHKYTYDTMYDVREDNPDIFIFCNLGAKPSETISFKGCREYIKNVLVVLPSVIVNNSTAEKFFGYIQHAYEDVKPDVVLLDKLPYEAYCKSDIKFWDAKVLGFGNPKFDEIHDCITNTHDCPSGWQKLKGKKVFLLTTDHDVWWYAPRPDVAFDIYIRPLLEYFLTRSNELGLIIRLHPHYIVEVVSQGIWDYDQVNRIKKCCTLSENIVWDDTEDYGHAFNMADAIFADVNCGITCSALITGKPICTLRRNDVTPIVKNVTLAEKLYQANNVAECADFIKMVEDGEDYKKDERIKHMKTFLFHDDGANGKRIFNYIVTDVLGLALD